MPTKTIITSDIILNEALRVLSEKPVFLNLINKEYNNKFANRGAQIGATVDIRKPAQLSVRKGMTYADQDFIQESFPLTVDKVMGIDMSFDDADLTMHLNDFSRDYIEPAIHQLATSLEADINPVALRALNSVYNASGIGYRELLTIRQKLSSCLAPIGKRCNFIVNPVSQVEIMMENKGLFNPASEVSSQFMNASIGSMANLDFYESNILPTVQLPADIVGTVALGEGTDEAVITGFTDTQIIPDGMRFTVDGCYNVHPETKAPYTTLKEFVVKGAVEVDGATTVKLVGKNYSSASKARQNISELPAGGSAVNVIGGAGVRLRNNIALDPKAFTFVTVDMLTPKGMDMAGTKNLDGISMSFVRGFDITERTFKTRLDIRYGFVEVRPEWACLAIEPDV